MAAETDEPTGSVTIERVPVGKYRYRYRVLRDGVQVGDEQTSLADARRLAKEHGGDDDVTPAVGASASPRKARPRVHGTVRGRVGRREVTVTFATVGMGPDGVEQPSVRWDGGECDPRCARTFALLVKCASAFAAENSDALHLAASQGFAVTLNT